MKQVSNDFIEALLKYGKQYECTIEQYQYGRLITEAEQNILTEDDLHYLATEEDNESNYITIANEEIYSINPIVNGNLLRSNMKATNFKTTHQIRVGTKVRFNLFLKLENTTEQITSDYYYITERELDEATGIWSYTSYDAMLFSMVEYTTLQSSTPPHTIGGYIYYLAQDIGLTYTTDTSLPNRLQTLATDKYANLGYTYREILDDLAEVTGRTVITKGKELFFVDINETRATLDEEWLKNINAKFSKKYGPINSLVLSRAESDNIYRKDDTSIAENGLCELKITDNLILDGQDRDSYIDAIWNSVKGITYYLNDFESPGILVLEFLDAFDVQIDGFNYRCVLLNDELTLDGGMSEHIYTEEPEQTKTDYEKADTTDRRIKRAYILVDKTNANIELVAEDMSQLGNTNYIVNSNFATGNLNAWNSIGETSVTRQIVQFNNKNYLNIANSNTSLRWQRS